MNHAIWALLVKNPDYLSVIGTLTLFKRFQILALPRISEFSIVFRNQRAITVDELKLSR